MLGRMTPEHASDPFGSRKMTILIAALLGALAFAVFSPALGYGFLNYDDDLYVYDNPEVTKGLSKRGFQYAFTTRDVGTWAPLTWLSYQLDTSVLGFRARSYHATNLFLHALAGALLLVALRRMQLSLWVSVTATVLFLFHPLRSESVVWIAERKDVLCAFFWMLGLLAYAFYSEKQSAGRWALVFLSFVAGLMSKMMMVTFPFALLLLDYWPLNRMTFAEAGVRKKMVFLVLEKLPFFVVGALSIFITSAALKDRGAFNPVQTDSVSHFLRVPENYFFYLQKLFWPTDLSVLYPLQEFQGTRVVLCALLLAAITILAVWQTRKMPALPVGWLWFLGTLVPVIGFVPFSDFAVADRYSYIPSVGLTLACAVAAENLFRRFVRARWLAAGAIGFACVMATTLDLPRWRDSLSLYNDALQIGPHYVAYNNRGTALTKAGQLEAALKDFERAIQLRPTFAEAYNNRGSILSDLGRYEEAMHSFAKAIETDPNLASAYDNRGNVYTRTGKPEEGIRDYNHCLKLRPKFALCYNNRAAAYFQMRRFAEAAADIETCRNLGGQPHPGLVQALADATKDSRQ